MLGIQERTNSVCLYPDFVVEVGSVRRAAPRMARSITNGERSRHGLLFNHVEPSFLEEGARVLTSVPVSDSLRLSLYAFVFRLSVSKLQWCASTKESFRSI